MGSFLMSFISMLVFIFSVIGLVTVESRVFRVFLFFALVTSFVILVYAVRRLWKEANNLHAPGRSIRYDKDFDS